MTKRFFFDLPVYRLPESQYYANAKAYAENVVFPPGTYHGALFRDQGRSAPTEYDIKCGQILEAYGGCWKFNEITGYIRLYFLGNQIRGEYFAPRRQRIVRTRTRTLETRTWKLAPEVEIFSPLSSTAIAGAVSKYIDACRQELPRRHIDTEQLNTLSPHIDWLALFTAG